MVAPAWIAGGGQNPADLSWRLGQVILLSIAGSEYRFRYRWPAASLAFKGNARVFDLPWVVRQNDPEDSSTGRMKHEQQFGPWQVVGKELVLVLNGESFPTPEAHTSVVNGAAECKYLIRLDHLPNFFDADQVDQLKASTVEWNCSAGRIKV